MPDAPFNPPPGASFVYSAGPEPEPPAPRAWDFDTEKLQRMLEAAAQAKATMHDLSDRRSEALNRRGRIRTSLEIQKAQFNGRANVETERQLQFAEAELNRLDGELEQMRNRLLPVVETFRSCEAWARQQGWSPDGKYGATTAPPAVVGTTASEAADAASRAAFFSGARPAGEIE